jgi:hypothetical protein
MCACFIDWQKPLDFLKGNKSMQIVKETVID